MSGPTDGPAGEGDPIHAPDATDFAFTRRTWVDAPPARVYELISDVSSISRFSPHAIEASYLHGAGPGPGAWITGRNRRNGTEWTTYSQVVRADHAAAFSFDVGGVDDGIVRWTWTFDAQGRGTVVQQDWQLLRMDPVLGRTRADLVALRRYMVNSAETTLNALAQAIAEERPATGQGDRGTP